MLGTVADHINDLERVAPALQARDRVLVQLISACEDYVTRIIAKLQTGKWRHAPTLRPMAYEGIRLLNALQEGIAEAMEASKRNEGTVQQKYCAAILEACRERGSGYAREARPTHQSGAYGLNRYTEDIEQICAKVMDGVTIALEGDCETEAARLLEVIMAMTDTSPFDLLSKQERTEAEEYIPALDARHRDAQRLTDKLKEHTPTGVLREIHPSKGAGHGGARAGAGRPKNAVPTVRVVFKLTPQQAARVRDFVAQIRAEDTRE